tara:strand:- start:56 stop:286 length:231 start_codon:yes stop_codon:yes gene_type:complete
LNQYYKQQARTEQSVRAFLFRKTMENLKTVIKRLFTQFNKDIKVMVEVDWLENTPTMAAELELIADIEKQDKLTSE